MPILEERLVELESLHLAVGNHKSWKQGACVMEAVARITGSTFNDAPPCVAPSIRRLLIRLNDRLPDEDRQELKRFITKVVGTNTGAKDEQTRAWMAADWAIRVCAPEWLDLVNELKPHAQKLRALAPIVDRDTWNAARPLTAAARDAAWNIRQKRWTPFREKFLERFKAELKKKGIAAAAADAAADAASFADAADAAAYAAAAAASFADAAAAAHSAHSAHSADAAAASFADAAAAAHSAHSAHSADAAAGVAYYYGSASWTRVRDAVYKVIYERLTKRREAMRRKALDGIYDLIDRMIAVGKKAA